MSTTTDDARGAPATPVFSRKATGLVRLGTPYRMLVANVINIGVTYAAFYFWLVPANFPQSSLLLSVLLVIPFGLAFLTAWALLAILMPRSGGEYVWLSRAVHPSIGFGVSGLTFMSWAFWSGLAGYWVATLVVGPICSVLGATEGSSTLIEIGEKLQTPGLPSWPWAFAVVTALASLLILSRGMSLYYRIQQSMWYIGLATLLLGIGVLVFGSPGDVKSGFNELAAAGGFHGDAARVVENAAQARPSGISFHDTLGMFALFSFAATTSGYIAGEVRTPRRSQLVGAIGGGAVYGGIVLLILLAMIKGVGGFNNEAAWVSINAPAHYPVESSPTFMLWMALLAKSNVVILILTGIGLTIFSVNWAPTVILSASRTVFAWGFDRLLPEPLTRVSRSGSPVIALSSIVAIGIVLISLYANGSFQYVAPYLALIFAWGLVCLVAMAVPFLPTTKALYTGSRADIRVAGIPLITIVGAMGTIFYAIAAYYNLSVEGLGLNTTSNILLTVFSFVVPAVLYFVIKAIRARQGIRLAAVYDELPPD